MDVRGWSSVLISLGETHLYKLAGVILTSHVFVRINQVWPCLFKQEIPYHPDCSKNLAGSSYLNTMAMNKATKDNAGR